MSENMMQEALSKLHSLHLPAKVSWWPLAPGWWFLGLVASIFLGKIVWNYRRYLFPSKLRRAAINEFRLIIQANKMDPQALISELSTFLRRVVLIKYQREEVASLTGSKWLEFLDLTGDTNFFTHGAGKVLVCAPYQKQTNQVPAELIIAVQKWMVKNL